MKSFLILFTLLYSNICFSSTYLNFTEKKLALLKSEALNKFDESYMPIEEEGKKDFYISAGVGKLHSSNIVAMIDIMKEISKRLRITEDELESIKNINHKGSHSFNTMLSRTSISKPSYTFINIPIERLKKFLIKAIYDINGKGWKDISALTADQVIELTMPILGEFNNILDIPTKLNVDLKLISNISFGYCINDNLKFEIEVISTKININYKFKNSDSFLFGRLLIYSLIPNIYYDYKIQDLPLRLYLGISLMPSISLVNTNITSDAITSLGGRNEKNISTFFFTHQVKFGVDYALNKKINMFCGYRFISTPIATALMNLTTHNIEAGLTFNF